MISILLDEQSLLEGKGGIFCSNSFEYLLAYKNILDSIKDGNNQKIILTDQIYFVWFKNFALRFEKEKFTFEVIDAKQALRSRLDIDIPDYVTNDEINKSNLLDLNLNLLPGFSFEDTILANFYSSILVSKTFPTTKIKDLLEEAATEKWRENKKTQLLSKIFEKRITDWISSSTSKEIIRIIQLFANEPTKLQSLLAQYEVLRFYPSIGESILGKDFSLIKSLRLNTSEINTSEQNLGQVVNEVMYYLNSLKIDSTDEVKDLIQGVSGNLFLEYEFIEELLRNNESWLSQEIIDLIESKFSKIYLKIKQRISHLRKRIRPQKPNIPKHSWGVKRMLEWATQEYLPYQSWCMNQKEFDRDMYALGDIFSNWYVENWSDIHANSRKMVFNIFPEISQMLKEPNRINLVLVIDNLSWTYIEELVELFQGQKFFYQRSEPYLSMAPTETEISKKCLLSGEVGYTKINENGYKDILGKGWVPFFNNDSFRYVSDIGNLDNINKIDANAYIINYLAIDKVLHQSSNSIGMDHQEHIHHLLSKLVEKVNQFAEKHDIKEKLFIHIISDHGSTCIPKVIHNDLDLSQFKSTDINIRSHRHISVSDKYFKDLPDNLRNDCFFLPKSDFLNPENYLCARRANRFTNTDDDIFVHGGLLPEEVIVPYILFEGAPISIQEPTIRLIGNVFRYRMETILLDIGNPNELPIEQVQFQILNNNIESDSVFIRQIEGKKKIRCEIRARFRHSSIAEELTKLHIRMRFNFLGEDSSVEISPEIEMKKMVEREDTDLFDV